MQSIKEQLREGLLTEDYNLVSELKSLSQEILTYFAKAWLREGKFFQQQIYIKNFVDPRNYELLGEMIYETALGVEIIHNYDSLGSFYRTHKTSKIYRINLRITNYQMEGINKEIAGFEDENEDELHSYIYWATTDFQTVLIHELQHAYDAFRSNGRFDTHKQNDTYQKKRIDTMFDRGLDARQSNHERYLKLTHEINARFSQAIEAVIPFDIKQVNGEYQKVPLTWNEYYESFVKNFYGWDVLGPRNQKRLVTRVAKTYQQFLDNQKDKN